MHPQRLFVESVQIGKCVKTRDVNNVTDLKRPEKLPAKSNAQDGNFFSTDPPHRNARRFDLATFSDGAASREAHGRPSQRSGSKMLTDSKSSSMWTDDSALPKYCDGGSSGSPSDVNSGVLPSP